MLRKHIFICFRCRPTREQQLMGDLPASRITQNRAFLHTAVDYAGPLMTRTAKGRGHKAHKSWIAVFVCMASKAVHLELVGEMTSQGFVAAFKRFTSRRGHCSDIYADNGTNFVGANREMQLEVNRCMNSDNWNLLLAESATRFHFAPPGSPHFNGLAEAAVKIARSALKRAIGEHTLTFEEMTTLLAQIEAVMNSRPLCGLTRDPNDYSALTPVKVNDIVVLRDENLPPSKWLLGRIVATHPGYDGNVRVVTVKTATAKLKRSIVKVCVLPTEM